MVRSSNTKNASWGAVAAIVNPVIQLASLPILFRELGPEMFGVWTIINSVNAASGIAFFGFGASGTKFIAIHRAKSELDQVHQVAQTTFSVMAIMGIIAAVSLYFSAEFLGNHIFKVSGPQMGPAVLSFQIAALVLMFRFLFAALESTLRGFERYDVDAVWGIFVSIGSALCAIVIVLSGGALPEIVSASAALLFISLIGLSCSVWQQLHSFQFLIPRINPPQIKKLASFGFFSWIQSLNGLIFNQGDRLLVAGFLGAAAAGQYAVIVQIVVILHTVMGRAAAFLFPHVAREHAKGDVLYLLKLFNIGTTTVSSLAWVFGIVLLLFAEPVLLLIMGAGFAETASPLIPPLALWSVLLSGSLVQTQLLNGSGLERLAAISSSATSITFMVSLYFLLFPYGLFGAAIARLISLTPSIFSRSILMNRIFPVFPIFTGIATWIPILLGVTALFLLGYSSAHSVKLPPDIQTIGAVSFSTLIYLAAAYYIHFSLLTPNRYRQLASAL